MTREEDKIVLKLSKSIWDRHGSVHCSVETSREVAFSSSSSKRKRAKGGGPSDSLVCRTCGHILVPSLSKYSKCAQCVRFLDLHVIGDQDPLPKSRPFDIGLSPSKFEVSKVVVDDYLQTSKFLEYINAIMEVIPSYLLNARMVIGMQRHEEALSAFGCLTYWDTKRHLIALRVEHIQRWVRPLLTKMMFHPKNASVFNAPIDAILLEIPQYLEAVRSPVDLGTIRSRLQRGYYESVASAITDIRLVFSNAMAFNAPSHPIYELAKLISVDLEAELETHREKYLKEVERKAVHSCSLCMGSSCPLCGEKCLKFEPPVLVCHGACSQRIKRNSIYFVTRDGASVWCQKCFASVPHVIYDIPGKGLVTKKDVLKRRSDEEVAEPWVSCDTCGHWVHQTCALYNDRLHPDDESRDTGYQCPLCKVEVAASAMAALNQSDPFDYESPDEIEEVAFKVKASSPRSGPKTVCDEGKHENVKSSEPSVVNLAQGLHGDGDSYSYNSSRVEAKNVADIALKDEDIKFTRFLVEDSGMDIEADRASKRRSSSWGDETDCADNDEVSPTASVFTSGVSVASLASLSSASTSDVDSHRHRNMSSTSSRRSTSSESNSASSSDAEHDHEHDQDDPECSYSQFASLTSTSSNKAKAPFFHSTSGSGTTAFTDESSKDLRKVEVGVLPSIEESTNEYEHDVDMGISRGSDDTAMASTTASLMSVAPQIEALIETGYLSSARLGEVENHVCRGDEVDMAQGLSIEIPSSAQGCDFGSGGFSPLGPEEGSCTPVSMSDMAPTAEAEGGDDVDAEKEQVTKPVAKKRGRPPRVRVSPQQGAGTSTGTSCGQEVVADGTGARDLNADADGPVEIAHAATVTAMMMSARGPPLTGPGSGRGRKKKSVLATAAAILKANATAAKGLRSSAVGAAASKTAASRAEAGAMRHEGGEKGMGVGVKGKRAQRGKGVSKLEAEKLQWRASSLPRTALGDFLEKMVEHRLRESGFADAAGTVTVRLTSNTEHHTEVPEPILTNMMADDGTYVPRSIPHKQKCILLFQCIDGVDVCLFCLYVQEYDNECPAPNKSVVYIAYLDSVDYFRPMEARTLVYHEVLVGYLKWTQARGFKQGHIWACPPQRGDNFIFWCHPPHQRTPSRDRLNAWYNTMLIRALRVGALTEVTTLWNEYFMRYARKDKEETGLRGAARNSLSSSLSSRSRSEPLSSSSLCEMFGAASGMLAGPGSPRSRSEPMFGLGSLSCESMESMDSRAWAAATSLVISGASSSASSSGGGVGAVGTVALSTDAAGLPIVTLQGEEVPICPPVFEGDFWISECLRVYRLEQQRMKGCDGQDAAVNARKCRDLLKQLSSKPCASPFLKPVDPVALAIPTYPLIIKQPMDLGTIRDNLRGNVYKTILDYVTDVRLTFNNAMLFNPSTHCIHQAAQLLLNEFHRGMLDVIGEYVGANADMDSMDHWMASFPLRDAAASAAIAAAGGGASGLKPAAGFVSRGSSAGSQCSSPRTSTSGMGVGGAPMSRMSSFSLDEFGDESAYKDPSGTTTRPRSGSSIGIGMGLGMVNVGEYGSDDDAMMDQDEEDRGAGSRMRRTDSIDMDPSMDRGDGATPGYDRSAYMQWQRQSGTRASASSSEEAAQGGEGAGGGGAEGVERRPCKGKAFDKPELGFRGALSMMSDLSKCVFRLKEDLFLVKFADPREVKGCNASMEKGSKKLKSVEGEGSGLCEEVKGDDVIDGRAMELMGDGADGGLSENERVLPPPLDRDQGSSSLGDGGSDCGIGNVVEGTDGVEVLIGAEDQGKEKAKDGIDEGGKMEMGGGQIEDATAGDAIPAAFAPITPFASSSPSSLSLALPSSLPPHPHLPLPLPLETDVASSSMPFASAPSSPRESSGHGKGKGSGKAASKGAGRGKGKGPGANSGGVAVAGKGASSSSTCSSASMRGRRKFTRTKAASFSRATAEPDEFEDLHPECLDMLARLAPDTSDPDPVIKSPFVDSRHTFLEMCQYRHYQFDSLRRAKHSSLMLLYHLHNPTAQHVRPSCGECACAIRDVRWHCDLCPSFDLCAACGGKEAAHEHPLTPFRVTFV